MVLSYSDPRNGRQPCYRGALDWWRGLGHVMRFGRHHHHHHQFIYRKNKHCKSAIIRQTARKAQSSLSWLPNQITCYKLSVPQGKGERQRSYPGYCWHHPFPGSLGWCGKYIIATETTQRWNGYFLRPRGNSQLEDAVIPGDSDKVAIGSLLMKGSSESHMEAEVRTRGVLTDSQTPESRDEHNTPVLL